MSDSKPIPDSEVPGLKIKPQASGAVYVLKAKQRGTRRTVTVTYGKVAALSVREVRRWAKRDLALLSQGINPNTHKKAVAEGEKTLEEALDEFLSSRSIKDSTRKSYEQTIRRNLKDWLKRPITEITQQMIMARYHKIKNDVANATFKPSSSVGTDLLISRTSKSKSPRNTPVNVPKIPKVVRIPGAKSMRVRRLSSEEFMLIRA